MGRKNPKLNRYKPANLDYIHSSALANQPPSLRKFLLRNERTVSFESLPLFSEADMPSGITEFLIQEGMSFATFRRMQIIERLRKKGEITIISPVDFERDDTTKCDCGCMVDLTDEQCCDKKVEHAEITESNCFDLVVTDEHCLQNDEKIKQQQIIVASTNQSIETKIDEQFVNDEFNHDKNAEHADITESDCFELVVTDEHRFQNYEKIEQPQIIVALTNQLIETKVDEQFVNDEFFCPDSGLRKNWSLKKLQIRAINVMSLNLLTNIFSKKNDEYELKETTLPLSHQLAEMNIFEQHESDEFSFRQKSMFAHVSRSKTRYDDHERCMRSHAKMRNYYSKVSHVIVERRTKKKVSYVTAEPKIKKCSSSHDVHRSRAENRKKKKRKYPCFSVSSCLCFRKGSRTMIYGVKNNCKFCRSRALGAHRTRAENRKRKRRAFPTYSVLRYLSSVFMGLRMNLLIWILSSTLPIWFGSIPRFNTNKYCATSISHQYKHECIYAFPSQRNTNLSSFTRIGPIIQIYGTSPRFKKSPSDVARSMVMNF